MGAKFLHILGDAHNFTAVAQKVEDAPRPHCVTDRVIDPIFAGDAKIFQHGLDTAHADRDDHIVGVAQRFAAVSRCDNGCAQVVADDGMLRPTGDRFQRGRVDIHQRDLAVAERGGAEKVGDQAARKNRAAGADNGNFGHRFYLFCLLIFHPIHRGYRDSVCLLLIYATANSEWGRTEGW